MLTQEKIAEINSKRGLRSRWPKVFWIGFVLALLFAAPVPILAFLILFIGTPIGMYFAYKGDKKRKAVQIEYPVQIFQRPEWTEMIESFGRIAQSQAVYEVRSAHAVEQKDRKRQAGASALVKRSGVKWNMASPKFFEMNAVIPAIQTTPSIFLFPEGILVDNGKSVVVHSYQDVQWIPGTTRFIESGIFYPKDAPVVDHTWQYVNKNGTPDKRMKNNKKLPVLRYDELSVSVKDGMQKEFQISAPDTALAFTNTVQTYKPFEYGGSVPESALAQGIGPTVAVLPENQ